MAKLDRDYQRDLLKKLADEYPRSFNPRALLDGISDEDDAKFVCNLVYLEEHGLAISNVSWNMDGYTYSIGQPRITAAGMDFIADDGGLSAILGLVTIKLHEEDVLSLIGSRINESDLPQPEKNKWIDGLRSLSADSIKHLTMKLLDKGLENWPAALLAVQTAVHQM